MKKMAVEQQLETDQVTYFTVEKDKLGWKAVQTRNRKVIKSSYGLNGTRAEAEEIRIYNINGFWGFKLN